MTVPPRSPKFLVFAHGYEATVCDAFLHEEGFKHGSLVSRHQLDDARVLYVVDDVVMHRILRCFRQWADTADGDLPDYRFGVDVPGIEPAAVRCVARQMLPRLPEVLS